MGQNAPAEATGVFYGITPLPTVYVTDPQATGWGDTWNEVPVVRPGLHTDALVLNGTAYTNIPTTDVSGLATTNALAAVSGAVGTHTNDAAAHVSAADRAAWYGVTNLPSAGCSVLSMTDETNLVVTGATYSYSATVTNAYRLSIPTNAPAFFYGLTVYGTNACTLADNMRLIGTKTITGTNCVSFKPFTNGLWEVLWGGK